MKMFNRMDPDGDGYVTLEEFQAYMMENRSPLGSKKIGLKTKITLPETFFCPVELFNKIKDTTRMQTTDLEERGITFMDLAIHFK